VYQCAESIDNGELAVRTRHSGQDVAWHWQCFVCVQCHQLLVDFVYFYSTKNAAVYCGRHHAETLRPRCHSCDEVRITYRVCLVNGATSEVEVRIGLLSLALVSLSLSAQATGFQLKNLKS